jgi:hypothetical protein
MNTNFTQFSNTLWGSNLDSGEKLTYLALLSFAWNNKSSVWPSQSKVSEMSGLSLSTVKRKLSSLEKKQVIRLDKLKDGRNRYSILKKDNFDSVADQEFEVVLCEPGVVHGEPIERTIVHGELPIVHGEPTIVHGEPLIILSNNTNSNTNSNDINTKDNNNTDDQSDSGGDIISIENIPDTTSESIDHNCTMDCSKVNNGVELEDIYQQILTNETPDPQLDIVENTFEEKKNEAKERYQLLSQLIDQATRLGRDDLVNKYRTQQLQMSLSGLV